MKTRALTRRPARSRRLGRAALAAGLCAVAVAGVAACGSSGGGGATTGGAVGSIASNQVSTPTGTKDVASVTWYGDYRPLYSLDPIKLADYPEETVIPNICEPLLRVAPTYAISPGLASAYTFTNPTTLKLTIRSGVKFSDGTPMTADDVAYSLNRNMDPKLASTYAYLFSTVRSITATNATTVTVTFTRPTPLFISTLATLAGAVVEKAFTEKAGQAFGSPSKGVVCTGPFELTSYDGSSKLVLTRNDNYWDTAHKAHAKTFTFVYTSDPSALANALKSGDIEGGYNIPSNLLTELKSTTTGKVLVGGIGSTPVNIDVLMSKSSGVSADPRVRQAISMVLDRSAIAKTIFNGTADPLYDVSGPGVWGYAKTMYASSYKAYVTKPDVSAAKKLVEQAGAAGKTMTFGYPSGDPQSVQLATVIQQEAAQIGLKIKIVGLPNQQYGSLFSDASARQPYDMFLTKNYVELPEPYSMDVLYGASNGANNFSGYKNANVDALLTKASQQSDGNARAKLVIQAEVQLAKDLPSIPVVQPRAVVFQSSKITGATLTFSYMVSPWAAAIGGK